MYYCAKCGWEIGIGYQTGKGRKDRKLYCKKCFEIIEGVRDANGVIKRKALSG